MLIHTKRILTTKVQALKAFFSLFQAHRWIENWLESKLGWKFNVKLCAEASGWVRKRLNYLRQGFYGSHWVPMSGYVYSIFPSLELPLIIKSPSTTTNVDIRIKVIDEKLFPLLLNRFSFSRDYATRKEKKFVHHHCSNLEQSEETPEWNESGRKENKGEYFHWNHANEARFNDNQSWHWQNYSNLPWNHSTESDT